MIKVIDYDPSITRCDPPKKIRYDRTDFIADTEADISAMNSSNSEYLNYPAGSSVLCLGNGKWYLLNAECNEYLEFKDGGSSRTKANLYRSMISDNGEILVTLDDEVISDGMNVLSIGDTVTVTVTADSGYQVKTITLNGEEIENGAEFTVDGDILLIAEFEESSEEVIWEADMEFIEDGDGYVAVVELPFPAFERINTSDTYTLNIDTISFAGQFVLDDGQYALIDSAGSVTMIIAEDNSWYYAGSLDLPQAGTYSVKLVKSTTSSGYTWDGEVSENDIDLSEENGFWLHKVTPNLLTDEQLVGASITTSSIETTETTEITNDMIITAMEEPLMKMVAIEEFAWLYVADGDFAEDGFVDDMHGTYFVKAADGTGYTTSLTLAE